MNPHFSNRPSGSSVDLFSVMQYVNLLFAVLCGVSERRRELMSALGRRGRTLSEDDMNNPYTFERMDQLESKITCIEEDIAYLEGELRHANGVAGKRKHLHSDFESVKRPAITVNVAPPKMSEDKSTGKRRRSCTQFESVKRLAMTVNVAPPKMSEDKSTGKRRRSCTQFESVKRPAIIVNVAPVSEDKSTGKRRRSYTETESTKRTKVVGNVMHEEQTNTYSVLTDFVLANVLTFIVCLFFM